MAASSRYTGKSIWNLLSSCIQTFDLETQVSKCDHSAYGVRNKQEHLFASPYDLLKPFFWEFKPTVASQKPGFHCEMNQS